MYLNYINNYRAFAILIIVASHCISPSLFYSTPNSMTYTFLYAIGNESSALFVFIAGFLFQHLSEKFRFQKYIKIKLSYILLPYIIASLPGLLKTMFIDSGGLYQSYPIWQQVFLYYLTGTHMAVLWFMPTVFLFYIVAPLLHVLDQKRFFYYSLPIFMILSVLVPREVTPYHNPLQSFVHFFSFYMLGMFASHYKDRIILFLNQRLSLLTILFFALFFCEIAIRLANSANWAFAYFELFHYIRLVVGCFFILSIIYQTDHLLKDRMSIIATMSFGVYFIHSYFVSAYNIVIDHFGIKVLLTVPTFLLFFLLIFLSTILSLYIIKKILKEKSRFLVGY